MKVSPTVKVTREARFEARHTRLCFGLASAYAGSPLSPGAFPFRGNQVEVECDLTSIAVRAVREGCVGETIAALIASEELDRATDPVVRAVLAAIADDEARHAELAWRSVAWAIRVGGEDVRNAVAVAFAEMLAPNGEDRTDEAAHTSVTGRLCTHQKASLIRRANVEVLGPSADALLASSAPEASELNA